MILNCYGRVNNKYMSKVCDEIKLMKYIIYFDVINFYGWVIC